MDIFINKKQWSQFSADQMEEFKESIFNYYRNTGFPYFNLSKEQRVKIFEKLCKFDSSKLLKDNNILSQNMLGLNLANYYMPHMWEVKCGNFYTPFDTFNDNERFKIAINKRIQLGDNISDAGIRKALCWTQGTQRVSNFRPTIAKYIYDNYSGGGNVLDFSSGFGGRLFGALSSDKVKYYFGIEPSTQTYNFLYNIIKDFDYTNKSKIYPFPLEDTNLKDNYFDLAFSSPPYYLTEKYSDEPTQSCNRYKTKEEWREKFLKVLIEKCHKYLKSGGYFIINIANVKTYNDLESDTIKLANDLNFEYIKTYQMSLSALMKKGFKYEPIFVFRKK